MYDGVPFSGKLVKLRLKSNALNYGPIQEPDTEIEQKLEVSVKKKTARLSCYNFGNGAKYLLNQVYVRKESEKDIRDILAMFEAVFSAYEPTGFVCDAGSWELVLTNDKRERFHYEGTLCMDLFCAALTTICELVLPLIMRYITNEGIEARNAEIAKLADDRKIFFLDVNPLICDETGGMVASYTYDGVHLKAQYIPIWLDFLKEHAVE